MDVLDGLVEVEVAGDRGVAPKMERALHPKWRGGRPKAIDEQTREKICSIARASPADWKITALSSRSLAKLTEHLIAIDRVDDQL
ncbi:hypothetical protein P3H15_09265 [Rhodococcus sp. T2V]|uniref:hypothetical protein n=1 Tax=Rhodococcus sp. T2V TaxID=3034164 RepID=UPI0023E1B4C2|nr:hypothetical protein [Rhodococcus sp. T2V]MDF3305207.1 hypothetical protein [Rhodococcus sp. T2V]